VGDTTSLQGFGGWLDKIRAMVPARTMTLYVTITALYASVWPEAKDLPVWVPFVVVGLCLVFQIVLGISRKKKVAAIVVSAIAFALYGLAVPYSGILGVLHVSGAVNFVFAAILAAYCLLIPLVYTGNLAEEAAGQ
jgi:hypothetical protein